MAAKTTGMHPKPEKCVLIIGVRQLTEELIHVIRNWLSVHVPAFKDFRIESSGKYLGWYMGFKGMDTSYKEPLDNMHDRVNEIASAPAPAAVAIGRYTG